jgi:type II secretory pathway pseudopilin PulG
MSVPVGVSGRRFPPPPPNHGGVSLVEAMVALAVLGVLSLLTAPSLVVWRQQQQLESAVRHLALQLTHACARAVASGRTHGLALEPSTADLSWFTAVDGDGDGLSSADLNAGVDVPIDAGARLARRFPGVTPGRPAGVPTVAGGAADRFGLAFGRSRIISCSPAGGARAGTLYLRTQRGDAAALRVYGPTARLTLWWWEPGEGWARLR